MKKYVAILRCGDCGDILNTSHPVEENEKSKVMISSGFAGGVCPKGCRSTFSDLNLNTKLEWTEVETSKADL